MKLFVWYEPYDIKWGGSALYVMAEDLEQAKKLAAEKVPVMPDSRGEYYFKSLKNMPEPDMIFDGPSAVIYEWSE